MRLLEYFSDPVIEKVGGYDSGVWFVVEERKFTRKRVFEERYVEGYRVSCFGFETPAVCITKRELFSGDRGLKEFWLRVKKEETKYKRWMNESRREKHE